MILMNKPRDFTSFDVVAKLRGILGVRRMGHTGTLDPMATGVLPVFVGGATKACDRLPDDTKCYRAVLRLGMTTDTLDITGTVLSQSPVTAGKKELLELLPRFTGEILQTPPMYSAIKIGGRRLYDLAREGKEVERPARRVTIFSLTLLHADEERHEYTLDVDCSKGTYIRTLCDDIGRCLGCGAVLTELTRTRAGGFSLSQCHTFEELGALREQGALSSVLLPVQRVFAPLPRVLLDEHAAHLFSNGVRLDSVRLGCRDYAGTLGVYDNSCPEDTPGWFLGLAHVDGESGDLRMETLFYTGNSGGGSAVGKGGNAD